MRIGTGLDAIRKVLVVVVALSAACGDGNPPPVDAELLTDAPRDARTCVLPGDCPCFSNHDCPATHACVSQDPDGDEVSCIEGPRGAGAAGAPCAGEADCASALCVDDAHGGLRCSELCTTPSMCPAELPRCLFIGGDGICAREP